MKKITLVLLFCFCAVGFSQAQQTTEESGTAASTELRQVSQMQNSVLNRSATAGTHSFMTSDPNARIVNRPTQPRISSEIPSSNSRMAITTLSYNTGNVITANNSVACPGGDNSQARYFVLADFGITREFTITDGEIGVQSIAANEDVTVNVIAADGAFPTGYPGAGTLLGSEVVTIPLGSDESIISYSFTTPVVVPAGTDFLIVEVVQANTGNQFFIGGTADETADSYLASANCGLAEYGTTASIGFPDAHYYITVTGDQVEPPLTLPLTFEAPQVVAFSDFNGSATQAIANPDASGINTSATVAENTVPANAAFAGVNIALDYDIISDKRFRMDVWSSVANTPVLLKLENSMDPTLNRERQYDMTTTGAWEEAVFDFGLEGPLTFDSITIFMNFNMVDAASQTYYWDNVEQFSPPPGNDLCDFAESISCGDTLSRDSAGNGDDNGNGLADMWFAFTSTTPAEYVTVSTCGQADFDTLLTVYDSCGGAVVASNDDGAGCAGFTSELVFQADGVTTYYIAVDDFNVAGGAFSLSVSCTLFPSNDEGSGAIAVECGSVTAGTTINASIDDAVAGNCDDTFDPSPTNPTVDVTAPGVWYSFTDTSGLLTDVTANLCDDADFNTKISVYSGDLSALVCVAANDDNDACAGGGVVFTVNNGPLAGSYDAVEAAFGGEFTTTAITSDMVVMLDDDTTGDPTDACDPLLNGADLTGKIAIARRGACAFTDKVFAAQEAGAIAVLVVNNDGAPITMGGTNPDITIPALMIGEDDGNGIIAQAQVNILNGTMVREVVNGASTVEFVSDGSSTYYILVHGSGTETGDFNLSVDCVIQSPPNDMIANSIDVDEVGFPYTDPAVAMPYATVEAGSPADCDNTGAKGVWYNFVAEGDGTATASITTPGAPSLFFTVNGGPLAGSYDAIAAAFGGEFTQTVITSDTVVMMDDDSGSSTDPNDACDPLLNGADLSGKIAIARRGACAFTDKVFAAQEAGAIAVIVVNNQPGGPIVMGGTNADITIPALMLGDIDGEAVIAEVLGGGTLNASMGLGAAGFSAVTFYTAPDENAVETDLVLVDWFENQCLPGTSASIPTVAGQAYYVYVANHDAVTDIVIDGTNLGAEDNTIEGFSYYPNPTEGRLNLSAQDNIESVVIYNMLGQIVIDQNINATTSEINISELATGTYILQVSVNGQIGAYQILKK